MDSTIIMALSLGLLAIYMVVRLISGKTQNSAALAAKIRDGASVVDVRNPAEFSDGHFESALNIPVDELPKRLAEIGTDKNRCIIVYCASGSRAGRAAKIIRGAGFSEVVNAGGIFNMPRDQAANQ